MTSVGSRRRIHVRQLLVPRREDGSSSRGDAASRTARDRRRASRSVSRAPRQRSHDRTGRIALRAVPDSPARRRCRRDISTDASELVARAQPWNVRHARSLEGMRRLRLHAHVRGRMPHSFVCTAWRREHADMSQAHVSNRRSLRWRTKSPVPLRRRYNEDSGHQEGHRERQTGRVLRRHYRRHRSRQAGVDGRAARAVPTRSVEFLVGVGWTDRAC